MISGISKIISAAALTLMVFTGAQAKPSVSEQNIKTKAKEDTVMTMSRATLLVPRPALEPVKSIDPSSAAPIDTMDTGNPAVKILLMANHTWKYYKDPSVSSHSEIFNRYWSDEYPNPYKMDLKDLNDDISIWVVDTLKEYHCPYQTKVYSPFGYRHGRRHMGVDLPLKTGTPVVAAFSGKVRMSKYYRGYGNLVVIRRTGDFLRSSLEEACDSRRMGDSRSDDRTWRFDRKVYGFASAFRDTLLWFRVRSSMADRFRRGFSQASSVHSQEAFPECRQQVYS